MTHTVLIITDDSDTVAERVAVELVERGIPVVTMDTADFPAQISMATHIESGSDSWTGVISTPRGDLDLAGVGAVYMRRPTQFRMDEEMTSPERAFAYSEARYGFGGVLSALRQSGTLWVNDPMAAMRAEYKPVQLALAARIGLKIPKTLITSDPHAAHAWAKGIGEPIVYKPLGGIWHADEGQVRVVYTTPIKDLDDLRDPAMSRTAQMFQAWIDKACEARAVVVGSQVLTVRIDSSTEQGTIDWRSDYDSLSYERIDLPGDVRDRLVELHERLGLIFGAVDLVCDTHGQWYFLETNQSGEWGWLNLKTGLPVHTAMADVLQKGPAWAR
ncbi:ATP-grasp ribosomal peptide maturase, SAV_5884 family [Sinosporangium album]|uniref:ATP-grasp ribosomal peptide maturase, SAV_5884 family n=1 Tax=Sinosporangium album TaxID=504805 RepID=A0A1G8F446_9ACTN|nr:ATP-grasp ribosomal peptide maturase [Sinosporangium album]SDH76901.1 ATP-grasp ribosomal peptide maturase, SAV_5884 family [Sinosporangium album]